MPDAGRGKEDDSEANAAPGNSGRVLDEILAGVREDVAARQQQVPLDRVKELAAAAPAPKDAYAALRVPGVGVIAEVKRSSPSKGQLAEIPDSPIVTEVLHFEDLPLGSRGTRRAIARWSDGPRARR